MFNQYLREQKRKKRNQADTGHLWKSEAATTGTTGSEASQKSSALPTCLTSKESQKEVPGTSLVVQWLRIRLPMQGTRVQALAQKDPTCRGATEPTCLEPMLCRKRSHCNEKPVHRNKDK